MEKKQSKKANPQLGPRLKPLTDGLRQELFESAIINRRSSHWCRLAPITENRYGGDYDRLWSDFRTRGRISIRDEEDKKTISITYGRVFGGERRMVSDSDDNYAGLQSYARILAGTWDGADADTWFQFVVLNAVVYG